MAVPIKFDGITSSNRTHSTQNRAPSQSAKGLHTANALQSKPRSMKDAFTPSNSLEEVSFGLSKDLGAASGGKPNNLEEVSFGFSRTRSESVDGASPMLISNNQASNKMIDKASVGLNIQSPMDVKA